MIEIKGLVLSNDDKLVGFLVNEDGDECILTQEDIILKSKHHNILNVQGIRKELIDGEEHVFIDLEEQVTENVLYEVDRVNKVYSKKKRKVVRNDKTICECNNINEQLAKKVFKLSAHLEEDKYSTFFFKNYDEDAKKYFDSSVKNIKLKDIWSDVHVYSSKEGEPGDCSHQWGANGHLVFSEKAIKALQHLLVGNAEILPLIGDECKYYLINVTNYIDAVDYDRAIVKTILGYRISFDKIAFKPSIVENNHIFKVYIDEMEYTTEIFVSEQFKHEVLRNGLTGFSFKAI